VVTDATPKYFSSRCVQILIAALPQSLAQVNNVISSSTSGGSGSGSGSNVNGSQLALRYSHQLLIQSCRDVHLHPSEARTEAVMLSIQVMVFVRVSAVVLMFARLFSEIV
jgi:hypothetical protein